MTEIDYVQLDKKYKEYCTDTFAPLAMQVWGLAQGSGAYAGM